MTASTLFVEASQRVKDILKANASASVRDIPSVWDIHELSIKYHKTVLYSIHKNNILIIDEEFSTMFKTAYVTIKGIPDTFVGSLEDYQICVFLLYRQLKWNYEEGGICLAKFRVDIFERIAQLTSRDILPFTHRTQTL